MSGASFGSGSKSAPYWAIAWGVGVGMVEYLTVAPIDDWGSPRQLLFWLLYWCMPYWCVIGRLFVWLADHRERIPSRGRLIAAVIALSGLSAALNPLVSIALISITRAVFPQFDHYAAESPMIEPMWVNLTSANYLQISLYQLWEAAFYGSLLVAARIFTVRVERTRYLLYQSAMARRRSESSLDTARLQALQTQIDPSLLLDSMQELEQRYRASPERAERLLEALVEFLRYAMHGLRVPDSTLGAELQLARAFSHLQHERGIESAWHVVEEPPSQGVSLKFPSLLMLPLMALGGSGGRPLLRVRVQSGQVVLSLHGLSRGVSVELRQQIQARLYAMYGDRFHFEFQPSTPSQLRITLQSTHRPSGEVYA